MSTTIKRKIDCTGDGPSNGDPSTNREEDVVACKRSSKESELIETAVEKTGRLEELVRRIMTFSSMEDLLNFSKVSQLWKACSQKEQVAIDRVRVTSFCWNRDGPAILTTAGRQKFDRERELESGSANLDAASDGPEKYHFDLRKTLPDPWNKEAAETHIPHLAEFHRKFEEFSKSLAMTRMNPKFAVVMHTYNEDHYHNDFMLDMSMIEQILPKGCQTLSLSCQGVITNDKEVENLTENSYEPLVPAVSAIIFPAFNHVRITPVELWEKVPDTSENSDSDPDWDVDNDYGPRNGRRRPRPTRSEIPKISECRKIFDDFTKKQIPQSDEIKCCLIFENATDQNTFDPTDLFLNSLLGVSGGNVAIGGCKGTFTRYSHGRKPNQNLPSMLADNREFSELEFSDSFLTQDRAAGLVFSVPRDHSEAMEAFSICISEKVKGAEAFVKELREKRDKIGFPRDGTNNSVAFIFTCCGRGAKFHRREGVELTAFKQVFPNTPVGGMFVLGEIGHQYCNQQNTATRNLVSPGRLPCKSYNASNRLRHTFSAMILLMVFK